MPTEIGLENTASARVPSFSPIMSRKKKALTDYLRDLERQLRANGSFQFIGTGVAGLREHFAITPGGLIAAAHRQGAEATRRYLETTASNGFSSRSLALNERQRAVETRLRTFADAPYE